MMRWLLLALAVGSGLAAAQPQAVLPSTADARFLTTGSVATDYWPCFSADGKVVLFSRSFDGGKRWELFTVASVGGHPRRFTHSPLPVSATRAAWSIRHNTIAFTGTSPDGKSSVWIINADGTNARRLVLSGVSDNVLYPSWYPDGEHLAVVDAVERVIKRIDRKGGSAV